MLPKILINTRCEHAEGPIWHPVEKCLYWVDISAKQLHKFEVNIQKHTYVQFDKMPGTVVPMYNSTDLLVAFEDGIAILNTKNHELNYKVNMHQKMTDMRANDGKCDAAGRFWIGTMSKTAEAQKGNLYCLQPDFSLNKKIELTTISNGIIWSNDNQKMFFIDSVLNSIQSFDYDLTSGNLSSPQTIVHEPSKRYFDGMTIDTNGMLWVAHCGDSCIRRWNPTTGTMLLEIAFPCPLVTSLTFGGNNFKTLYITTSQENMTQAERTKYPLSGAIFYIETEFTGLETQSFGNKIKTL